MAIDIRTPSRSLIVISTTIAAVAILNGVPHIAATL
jgi:hypothetical protein